MSRTTLYAVGAVCLALALGFFAWQAQHTITSNLPPRIPCLNEADAREKAGLQRIAVLGTGSMAPFIPAAPPGADPYKTVVAYVVLEPLATYEDVHAGDLCLYESGWTPGLFVLHPAALKDGGGWLMSGINNARSEPHWRVTGFNFKGIVARVYVWPLK